VNEKLSTSDDILSGIRASGGRVTSTKRALIAVLLDSHQHLSADEITTTIQQTDPRASASTIYRNLEELETLGFVVHAHLGRAAAVYHLAGPVHGHLLCSTCGATIEVPSQQFEPLVRAMRREYGFDVNRHHLALSGVCAACQSL
jgi:Fur family ferric uptake transcriptional regulator